MSIFVYISEDIGHLCVCISKDIEMVCIFQRIINEYLFQEY